MLIVQFTLVIDIMVTDLDLNHVKGIGDSCYMQFLLHALYAGRPTPLVRHSP
jgi:hypothetical protein